MPAPPGAARDRERRAERTGTFISGPPGAEEEAPAARCRYCREEIYEGETYYRVDGRAVCEGCLDALARDYFRLYKVEGD